MKINKTTIARTIVLFVALINAILQILDIKALPIDNELINDTVSVAFLLVGAISSWWKNNSFTERAVKADEYFKQLKEGE